MSNQFQDLYAKFQKLIGQENQEKNLLEQGTGILQKWIDENISNLVD